MRIHRYEVAGSAIKAFSFETDEELPEFLCSWVSDWLVEYVESGAEFVDGQTVQFGWWLLQCEVAGPHIQLLAPVPESFPIKWGRNISHVVHSMMLHNYVPESYGLVPDIPSLRNTATVGTSFAELPMFINRMEPVENGLDSGWFIGSARDDVDNNDPSQLSVMSLYEACMKVPWVHEFLSMPIDTQVVFDSQEPQVLRNYDLVQPLDGSFVAQRRGQ